MIRLYRLPRRELPQLYLLPRRGPLPSLTIISTFLSLSLPSCESARLDCGRQYPTPMHLTVFSLFPFSLTILSLHAMNPIYTKKNDVP